MTEKKCSDIPCPNCGEHIFGFNGEICHHCAEELDFQEIVDKALADQARQIFEEIEKVGWQRSSECLFLVRPQLEKLKAKFCKEAK